MRALPHIVLLVLSLAVGCGEPEPTAEERARAALLDDGFGSGDLTLTEVEGGPEGTYDFSGIRDGIFCRGTVRVVVDGAQTRTQLRSQCGGVTLD